MRTLLEDKNIDVRVVNRCIAYASDSGNLDMVRCLMEKPGSDPNYMNDAAIVWASSKGHSDVVRELLKDKRVDPGVNRNSPIKEACANGHVKVMNILFESGRLDGSTLNEVDMIVGAARLDKVKSLEFLLDREKTDLSKGDHAIVRAASLSCNMDTIEWLLSHDTVDKKFAEEFRKGTEYARINERETKKRKIGDIQGEIGQQT
jgi:hypothetical protein